MKLCSAHSLYHPRYQESRKKVDKNGKMRERENEKREGEEGEEGKTRDDDISTLVVHVCVFGV